MNRVHVYADNVTEQAFFGTHGFGALTALSARVTEDLLAPFAYRATVVAPVEDPLITHVTAGAVLGIPCVDGMEPFRVTRTRKTLTTITAECWHITQDLRDGLIENRAWEDKQLSEVWGEIIQAGGHTVFSGVSSIDRVESVRIVRRSVWEAIVGDQDNSVLSRWGGEVSRSGWSVNIQDRRGEDRDWQIRYGKNLTGINDDVDVSDVIHAVLPTYTLSDTAVHTMAVQYCPGYSTVDRPRTVPIHYSNIAETEAEAEQLIADRIQLMWTQKAHLPRASCVVEFLDLARVGVDLPWSEDVRIGDRIRAVWVGHVDIDQRVVRTEWDALAQKWDRVVLGQPERSLAALTGMIEEQLGGVRNQLDSVLSTAVGAALLLNETYANALGYYQTDRRNEATGAIITYIHDAPALEDSVWIATMPEPGTYLWTDQGWNDGDPVWTQGISNDGNMVIRRLTADLIRLSSDTDSTLDEVLASIDESIDVVSDTLGRIDTEQRITALDRLALKAEYDRIRVENKHLALILADVDDSMFGDYEGSISEYDTAATAVLGWLAYAVDAPNFSDVDTSEWDDLQTDYLLSLDRVNQLAQAVETQHRADLTSQMLSFEHIQGQFQERLKLDAQGMTINVDDDNALTIKNDGMRIYVDGVERAEFTSDGFAAEQGRVDVLQVGAHIVSRDGDITVWRPI